MKTRLPSGKRLQRTDSWPLDCTVLDTMHGRRPDLSVVRVIALVFFGLTTGRAYAQYHGLATTDDGSVLYFSSNYRLKPGLDGFSSKIFALDANGPRLIAKAGADSNGFNDFTNPDVSGDGSLQAYTATKQSYSVVCGIGGSPFSCQMQNTTYYSGTVQPAGTSFVGQIRLSENGRYGLMLAVTATPLSGPMNMLSRVDLSTGEVLRSSISATSIFGGPGRAISNDGTAVIANGQLAVAFNSYDQVVMSAGPAFSASIDAAGVRIAYESRSSDQLPRQIVKLYDLASGLSRVLVSGDGDSMHPVLSNDGQTVLFLSNADLIGANPDHHIQVFIIQVDGSGLAQLTSEPHGVTEAALSGDAAIAYVETDTGRILRIGTADGSVIELIGRTPAFGGPSGGAVPGSQNHLYGSGLAEREESAQSPLPASLGGTQLLIDGQPAPLSFASPTEIRFQIPWEQTANPGVPVMVTVNSDASPFEAPPAAVYLSRFSPWFEYPDARLVPPSMRFAEIFHSDGSQVLPSNPAAPGEVLHFSMSGLGTVTPALPTGQSGTAALTNAFECRLGVNSSPVEVISAGMTPDAVGLYQIVIRVSAEVTNGGVLSCGDFISPGLYGSGSIFLPIAGR